MTKFFHVRDRNRTPVATVAMRKYPQSSSYLATLAVCSVKDQFSKDRGRLIADGRMEAVSNSVLYDKDSFILSFKIIEKLLGANSHMRKRSTRDSLDLEKIRESLRYVARQLDKAQNGSN